MPPLSDADDREPDQVGFHRCTEHIELGKKAPGHRDPDQREQKDGQRRCQQRRTAAQAFVVLERHIALARVGEVADNCERAQVHRGIGREYRTWQPRFPERAWLRMPPAYNPRARSRNKPAAASRCLEPARPCCPESWRAPPKPDDPDQALHVDHENNA